MSRNKKKQSILSSGESAVLDTLRVTAEVLSPKDFLELTAAQKTSIKTSEFIAPALGRKGFGGVLVRYKSPVFKVA